MADFLSKLKNGPLLCDGAMGTLLYSRGVFINRCYDELNLIQPEMILAAHQDYVKAGAEILETNTFGANNFRLTRHGCQDQLKQINRRGVELAREAAHGEALVAGSVGPLGVRIEPLGKISRKEARDAFAEQIEVLATAGVDLLILETFGSLDELNQAILAARQEAPGLPIVAQVTIDDDGASLDGASPEQYARRLEEFGADVIGCNCSVGPAAMLEALERMRAVTKLPLSAQPNAGTPRNIEGRNIYLCSPEYMASYARKFVAAGVSLIGGCCGTTPEHIKSMKSALRAAGSREHSYPVIAAAEEKKVRTLPLGERSPLGKKIADGEFVSMIEIVPPKGFVAVKEIEAVRYVTTASVDVVNIPDSPRASARMSNQALCCLIQQQLKVETILHYTCRDRNVLSIQSDLLGAWALGIRDLICITGDPPKLGNYPDATAVYDVDAIGLVNIVKNLNQGIDLGGNALGCATGFTIGVGANPGVANIDEEIHRFELKVEAGADYAVTQPVFDVEQLESFIARVKHCHTPIVAGIWPLISLRNAEFMRNELHVAVPDAIVDRMAAAKTPEEARQTGLEIAKEMLTRVRPLVQGVQISAPRGNFQAAVEILEVLK